MTIESKAKSKWVEIYLAQDSRFDIDSKEEAQTMIAQFRDVMEDFYRVWPELREEAENGLI